METTSQKTLKWIMRAGYGARGAIYVIVGVLALWAAIGTGQAEGTQDALVQLRGAPLGRLALWIIGLGLFAYLFWRAVAGICDVEDEGTDFSAFVSRTLCVTTGLIHGAIGVSVIGLALGVGGSGEGAQGWTQTVLELPMGRMIVAIGAAVLAMAGLYYGRKGWLGTYKDHLAASKLTTRTDPVLKAGLIIYGALLVLVAASYGFAAFHGDAAHAGGLGAALTELRGMIFGRLLLGGAALGLLAFAIYNFVEAACRVVPKISGPDVETLAARLKSAG